jgi:hypothetical protein
MDSADFIFHWTKEKFVHVGSLKKEERGLLVRVKGMRYLV